MSDFYWKSPKEGVIDARVLRGGLVVIFRAQDVRHAPTGLHAKVTIGLSEVESATEAVPVTSDVLNTDKEDYRHKIAIRCYGAPRSSIRPKFPKDFREAYPQEDFEQDLYDFCEEYYQQLMGTVDGGWVSGDTDKTAPAMLVDGYVLTEGGTVIYAPPKSVKSYLNLLLAVSIDAGVNTIFPVTQARVAYCNLERGKGSMQRRLGLVNRVLGLDPDRPLLMINERGKRLSDVYDKARRMNEEHGIKLWFLDSLTRGGFGDLNGNEEANRAMDYMNRLCPAWVAIAHTPRQDDSHIFGSQMFDAAMDIGINVRRQKKPDGTVGVGLNVKETNDTGSPPMRILAFEFDQYGLTNVRDAHRHEFPDIEETSQSPRTNAERILDQLAAFGKSSVTQIADDLGMNTGTVHSEIKRMLNDGKIVSLGKEGRSLMYGLPANFGGQS